MHIRRQDLKENVMRPVVRLLVCVCVFVCVCVCTYGLETSLYDLVNIYRITSCYLAYFFLVFFICLLLELLV